MEKMTVTVDGLMEMLSIGRTKAYEIGKESGAGIKLGRRRLFDVQKIKEYIDTCRD